jgi:hypothetical protein
MKKIFFTFLVSLVFASTVWAAPPDNFVISAKDLYSTPTESVFPTTSPTRFKQNTDGKVVYCIEYNRLMVHDEDTANYVYKGAADPIYNAVLLNGYPYKSITGKTYTDYFITATAIWYIKEGYKMPTDPIFEGFEKADFETRTYDGKPNELLDKILQLVDTAKNYQTVTPTLTASINSTKLKGSSTDEYYVSEPIKAVVKGDGKDSVKTYMVELVDAPEGTILTDVNGNEKTEFSIGEKFLVKVPTKNVSVGSTEFGVEISTVAEIPKSYVYDPEPRSYTWVGHKTGDLQTIIAVYPDEIPLSTMLNLGINVEPPYNPPTGSALIGIAWFMGIFTLVYGFQYFRNMIKEN